MQEGIFVFCTIAEGGEIPATVNPLLTFREQEGTTLVLRREEAEAAGLSYQFASRLITLTVHSSLEAVGFLAAVTARLAEAGIAVNAVSAFYHDHLFVPEHRADEALESVAKYPSADTEVISRWIFEACVPDRNGALGRIRTSDPRNRNPMLYPAELRAR